MWASPLRTANVPSRTHLSTPSMFQREDQRVFRWQHPWWCCIYFFLPRSVVSAKVHCSDVGFAHDGGPTLERGNVSWLLPNLLWGHSHGNCIASSFTLSAVIEHIDVAWRRCSRHASSHSFPSCSFCPCDGPFALIIQSLIWNVDLDGATGELRAEPRDGHAYKDDSTSSSS